MALLTFSNNHFRSRMDLEGTAGVLSGTRDYPPVAIRAGYYIPEVYSLAELRYVLT